MSNMLGRSLTLPCGAVLKNRLFKSAMTEGLATPDGKATDLHAQLYKTWAEGGCGVLVSGNVMVDHRYLERPGNVVIDHNGGEEMLRAWAAAATVDDTHLWMQISHPGRQCTRLVSGKPVSASDVQLKILGNFARPRALGEQEIPEIIQQYARVAKVAQETGFTGVQVHGAHGYLISQFLSPITNRRNDQWGGSLENRARLLLETVRAVRKAVGNDYPVAIKLNSADFQKGGFNLKESQQVVEWLNEEPVDLLEISGGTYEQPRLLNYKGKSKNIEEPLRESTRKREAYFLEYAKAIREVAKMPLAVTGGFRNAEFMSETLESEAVDIIGIARPLCSEPDLPNRLIADNATAAIRYEDNIRLGNGFWGPNSNNSSLKALNAQAGAAWYYRQIIHLAKNEPVNPTLTARQALIDHYRDEFRIGLARRKLMKASQA